MLADIVGELLLPQNGLPPANVIVQAPRESARSLSLKCNGERSTFSRGAWTMTYQRAALAHAVGAKARLIRVGQCSSVGHYSLLSSWRGEIFLIAAVPRRDNPWPSSFAMPEVICKEALDALH